MPILSAAFDFALGLVCLWIARAAFRIENDFLFSGFLWVAVAALIGALRLGGLDEVAPTHDWLSKVSRGPGTCAMGLGVLAGIYGPWAFSRWAAMALAIVGATVVHLLSGRLAQGLVILVLGSTLLVSLLVLAFYAFRRSNFRPGITALMALVLLLFAGFGISLVPLDADSLIGRVDLLHVVLILGYTCIWLSVRDVAQPR